MARLLQDTWDATLRQLEAARFRADAAALHSRRGVLESVASFMCDGWLASLRAKLLEELASARDPRRQARLVGEAQARLVRACRELRPWIDAYHEDTTADGRGLQGPLQDRKGGRKRKRKKAPGSRQAVEFFRRARASAARGR